MSQVVKMDAPKAVEALLTAGHAQLLASMPMPSKAKLDRMVRIAVSEVRANPKLQECTLESIGQSIQKILSWGLEVGSLGGEAFLIPRWNNKTGKTECTPQIGYRGKVKQVRNTGEVSTLYAKAVYAGDYFKARFGTAPSIEHEPTDESLDITHVYAVCIFKDGSHQAEVMTKKQVENHRDKFANKNLKMWDDHFEEMAKKTVVVKLSKMLPLSLSDSNEDLDDAEPFPVPSHIQVAVPRADVEKFKEVSAAQDIPTDADKELAWKLYGEACASAVTAKIDLSEFTTAPDRNDVKRVRAITDIIKGRCEAAAPSTYE